jgi:hypothetical protein
MTEIFDLPLWVRVILFIAYMSFEAWLGKTKKVESNSTLELVLNIAKTLLTKKS